MPLSKTICVDCNRAIGKGVALCTNKHHIAYYNNYRERFNSYRRKKRKINPYIWGDSIEYRRQRSKLRYRKDRGIIFKRLGNVCRCGISDVRCLQIDHINGGGVKETKEKGWGYYKYLLKLPEDILKIKYQILCANCNWIKRWDNGEQKISNWLLIKKSKR